jgi:two-component system, chemotaxis family, response regulator PixH
MKVLLVDDTPEIAELLTFALRDRGFDVVATGYTNEVDDLVISERADALVVDCTMFKMTESLFDIVRNRPELAQLPVVVVSDTPDIADASLRKRRAERVLLIPKPFTASHIARALDELTAPAGDESGPTA